MADSLSRRTHTRTHAGCIRTLRTLATGAILFSARAADALMTRRGGLAFSPVTDGPGCSVALIPVKSRPSACIAHTSRRRSLTQANARVFGPDGINYDFEFDSTAGPPSPPTFDDFSPPTNRPRRDSQALVRQRFLQEVVRTYDTQHVAKLARLAAAFCTNTATPTVTNNGAAAMPSSSVPSQSSILQIRNIEHVEILDLGYDHVDIQAVVCEGEGCVTIRVPLDFPTSCNPYTSPALGGSRSDTQQNRILSSSVLSATSECILNQLERLDQAASQVMEKREYVAAHYEEMQASERQRQALLSETAELVGGARDVNPTKASSDFELPSWWIKPTTNSELQRECESVVKLLNDYDFIAEVRGLATMMIIKDPAQFFGDPTNLKSAEPLEDAEPEEIPNKSESDPPRKDASSSNIDTAEDETRSPVSEMDEEEATILEQVDLLEQSILSLIESTEQHTENIISRMAGAGPFEDAMADELAYRSAYPESFDDNELMEEFMEENHGYAGAEEEIQDEYDGWGVKEAVVVAAGPSGIVLRALAEKMELLSAEPPEQRTVFIPVPFWVARGARNNGPAKTVEQLRGAVLSLVASAESYIDHGRPVQTAKIINAKAPPP
jgi:hypothetical protein